MSSGPTRTASPLAASPPQGYDSTPPVPPDGPLRARDGGERLCTAVTAVIVILPFVALGLVGRLPWGRHIRLDGFLPAVVLCTIAGSSVIGEHPFRTRHHHRAASPRPTAPLPVGESRHTFHHVAPTMARHGVDRDRLTLSGAVIRLLERPGRVHDERRSTPGRVALGRA